MSVIKTMFGALTGNWLTDSRIKPIGGEKAGPGHLKIVKYETNALIEKKAVWCVEEPTAEEWVNGWTGYDYSV